PMSEIEPDHATAVLCERRDALDVEQLTGEIVRAAVHDCRDLLSVFLQGSFDIFLSNRELAFARSRENERLFWIDPMMYELGLDGVGVRRESRIFHQDFEARILRM